MHVIVDAEHDHVVLPHEIDLRRIQRVAADDRDVVAIVPVSVLVRDDMLQPAALAFWRTSKEQKTVVAMP
jgi:hypothetical protein